MGLSIDSPLFWQKLIDIEIKLINIIGFFGCCYEHLFEYNLLVSNKCLRNLMMN